MKSVIAVSMILALLNGIPSYAQTVKISTDSETHKIFDEWISETPCRKIKVFNRQHTNRQAVELVLICRALFEGGLRPNIILETAPNYIRSLKRAERGVVTMPNETIWRLEIDKKAFYISDEIIRQGEYAVGIFALPSRHDINKVKTLKELRKFTAVTSKQYILDWKALKDMKIGVTNAPLQESMFKMVAAGHADFTTQDFTAEHDYGFELAGVRLAPVQGIKVGLNDSRHFVVSRKAPHAEKIYQALQRGLKKLRKDGVIAIALEESGFIHPEIKKWKLIN